MVRDTFNRHQFATQPPPLPPLHANIYNHIYNQTTTTTAISSATSAASTSPLPIHYLVFPPRLPHTDTMATDTQMEEAPPVTTGGELQPPSVVEGWTEEELFNFILARNVLRKPEYRTIFRNAEIHGKAFLRDGDDLYFWSGACHLPAGPSGDLAELVQTIKNMGKEESRGNVFHLGSVEPANTFTVESPSPPGLWIVEIARLKFLHGLLWGKGDSLRDTVLCEFEHPSWNRDTNSHIEGDMRTAVKLSLSGISSGAQLEGAHCLPCE
jgi:hypothetical protein